MEHSLGVIIDDGKARRICRERFTSLPIQCSVELLQQPPILTALSEDRVAVGAARSKSRPNRLLYVNGKAVKSQVLKHADEILLGEHALRYVIE